jgi:hypothetical protein
MQIYLWAWATVKSVGNQNCPQPLICKWNKSWQPLIQQVMFKTMLKGWKPLVCGFDLNHSLNFARNVTHSFLTNRKLMYICVRRDELLVMPSCTLITQVFLSYISAMILKLTSSTLRQAYNIGNSSVLQIYFLVSIFSWYSVVKYDSFILSHTVVPTFRI